MDFENVTDTPETLLNFPTTQDPFTRPEDTGAPSALATSTDTPAAGDSNKKLIPILILSIFVTLTIGAIATYIVINSVGANAQVQEDPYERYKRLAVPTKAPKPTSIPINSSEAGVTPQATQESTLKTTLKPEETASEEATIETQVSPAAGGGASVDQRVLQPGVTIPASRVNGGWRIVLLEPELQLTSLQSTKVATISATLFGPLKEGVNVCIENKRNTYQYFSKKKTEQIYEKICSETIDSQAARFVCSPYSEENGIAISEILLPAANCGNSSSTISTGSYIIYSKVHYNCTINGKAAKSITESDCADTYAVNSEQLTVNQ